ncbi:hypothetical protein GG681_06745 [Epibacterium sp. SM1969]|uniref:Uncharacterized protein n=1 Tax=Tritonibacter aquimaris TaxID=2663379 RepID=A0A844AVA2_9RHOB|nr:hypothetical protein [Tritonibacter aquimaris]MQY42334.1 hypothetical protein [Tritonibacter aquimaris]
MRRLFPLLFSLPLIAAITPAALVWCWANMLRRITQMVCPVPASLRKAVRFYEQACQYGNFRGCY